MKRIENTVFISYRRKDVYLALNVYQDLTHKEYDVFFDYTSIPSGDFEQIIIGNIKARAHFVIILTLTAFDRCSEPGDWLRREIETAIDEKRNIIPLLFDGFSFGAANVSEKLTGKLKSISRYNGMNVHQDYFNEAMERLRNTFLNVPLDAVLHPVSVEVQEVVKKEQLAANKALLENVELSNPVQFAQDKNSKEYYEKLMAQVQKRLNFLPKIVVYCLFKYLSSGDSEVFLNPLINKEKFGDADEAAENGFLFISNDVESTFILNLDDPSVSDAVKWIEKLGNYLEDTLDSDLYELLKSEYKFEPSLTIKRYWESCLYGKSLY
jgi:hypothetical protein